MTLKIGLTGGISSGKTTVAEIFKSLNIPVYNSDERAKWLMQFDSELKSRLIAELGNIYLDNGNLNKPLLRQFVFSDPEKRKLINSLVHPAVNKDFVEWLKAIDSKYAIKESALLFETENYKAMDFNILVFSPLQLRIRRLILRDSISQGQAMSKIKAQRPEMAKIPLADFIIVNDEFTPILPQVLNLHKFFLIHSI